ncbi:MAG: penicillin acylase family protein [Saprospiraceae bacterium]
MGDYINEKIIIEAIAYSQDYMKKHFGKSPVTLGELQRHSRGKVDLPVSGGPDVLAAMKSIERKDGRLRADSGDSYIELVRYSDEGVEIESVNAFGSSAKPDNPHYTDQMEMYVNRQLKKMTLDKEMIYKNAESIYHPK